MNYCENPFSYKRRPTREVSVGGVVIGGRNPIRIQSMTNCPTMDTVSTVKQIAQLAKAGCEIVRVTVPSLREAENLKAIKELMAKEGIHVPLVADIHFTPNAAMKAAAYVEKIRINPGNYADKKSFSFREYTDAEYANELERIDAAFRPLVERCRDRGIAMRIGVNHGSLSDRIVSRYGDTPEGMVASAVEFIRICERYGYRQLVVSMKASNTQVMIAAYRLLAARMYELKMDYPFHLGVTEAGDGDDGRVRSAVGIGALLEDGLGDTIRVSLTEDSVNEIPAARAIADKYNRLLTEPLSATAPISIPDARHPFYFERRYTHTVRAGNLLLGGNAPVRVGLTTDSMDNPEAWQQIIHNPLYPQQPAEILYTDENTETNHYFVKDETQPVIAVGINRFNDCLENQSGEMFVINYHSDLFALLMENAEEFQNKFRSILQNKAVEIKINLESVTGTDRILDVIHNAMNRIAERLSVFTEQIFLSLCHPDVVHANRVLIAAMSARGIRLPVVLRYNASHYDRAVTPTLYHASALLGSLLCDGIGDAVVIDDPKMAPGERLRLSYNILQASRRRFTRTEYITCPSCGRTQFNLQEVATRIKSQTAHLQDVKIAIMGCIVNGLGEMADADFGYIGAGSGKVNLYVGRTLVARNIDMHDADQELIALIKSKGLWKEPPAS